MHKSACFLVMIMVAGTMTANGQMLDQTPTRVQTALSIGLDKVGTLSPKSVSEIETSMWSLGCETLDRDLADWDQYKPYLQPLGIRRIRLQGGWGRTEKEKGVYDFAWLDRIVDEAQAMELTVVLETSYGNKLYDPKAALGPGGLLPSGDQTLAAWDKWVEAMARRYSARGVHDWLMYNEPNLKKGNSAEITVAFNIRTAEIIKRVDPKAKIGGLACAGVNNSLVKTFLAGVKEQGKTDLFHWLVYHCYAANPDSSYGGVKDLKQIVGELAPNMKLWQGEAGCASEEVQYALSGIAWTEISQAKWNARRMLGDLGHDVMSAVFTISDLSYHKDFISRYGLLKTDADNAIIKVKTVYYVVQNIVSVFNDSAERVADYQANFDSEKKLNWYAFRDKATGLDLLTFWDGSATPTNTFETAAVQIEIIGGHFKEPVWVDLMTGNIYAIAAEQISVEGETHRFKDMPVYDGPCMITDKSLLKFVPARKKK